MLYLYHSRIRSAICTIANHLGWSALPLEFTDINFTYRLIKGDNNIIMIMFLDYLQALYVYYYNILKSNPDPIQLESGVSYSNILKHRQDQQSYTTVGISELEESYLLNTVQDASPSTTLRNISNTRGGLNQHEEQQSTKQQSLHIANNQGYLFYDRLIYLKHLLYLFLNKFKNSNLQDY